MVLPLSGIRVIEVANYVAGPAAGALMADLGADVIKVEPPGGDVMRGAQARVHSDAPPVDWLFTLENRGKRSICVALDQPGGPEVVHRLVAGADIFLSNLFASRLAKYRLTFDELRAVNPRIVFTSVTGYGIHGPEADRPAFDFAGFWARSGIMSVIGHPGQPPVISRIAQGDHTTGMNALAATFAALRLRDLTGEAQAVEVSLQQTGLYTIATDIARVLLDGYQPHKPDRTAPSNPIFNTYQCGDGRWLMVVHMTPDPYWPKFAAAVGRPEWATDERYLTMPGRAQYGRELAIEISRLFAEHDFAYWSRKLDEHGLIWAPAATLPEVVSDPQLRAMGAFQPARSGEKTFETVGVPFYLAGAAVTPQGPAPQPGEHGEAILSEAGYTDVEVADLAATRVFG